MRYVEIVEAVLTSDPRTDWLPPVSDGEAAANACDVHVYAGDVRLRLERDLRRLDLSDHRREWSGALAPGAEWRVRCGIRYGATPIEDVVLLRRAELFADFTKKERLFLSPCLPVPRSIGGAQVVSRFDYQVARILDWGNRLDGFLERAGCIVEPHLTPGEHLARRRAAFQPPAEDVEPRTDAAPAGAPEDRPARHGLFGRRG